MVTRTYVVGENNKVLRRDNHTGPWIDVSIPSTTGATARLLDVMSDPNDPDRVIAVGQILGYGTNTGIMISNDAGATWSQPGGTWISHKFNIEVWWVDSNVIWIIGDNGNALLSTDGGLTFNLTAAKVGFGSYAYTSCIHALNAQVAVVAGSPTSSDGELNTNVWKTTDGGNTWIQLNGGASLVQDVTNPELPEGPPNGIWISPDQQRIVVSTTYVQHLATDGENFLPVTDLMTRAGKHLTWYPSHAPNPTRFRHVGGIIYLVNESVDQGSTWNITRYGDGPFVIRGAHFYTEDDGYYLSENNIYETSTAAAGAGDSLSHTEVSVQLLNAVWTGPWPPQPPAEDPPCGGCPEGFTLNPITGLCEHIDQVDPICDPASTYTVGPGAQLPDNYSAYGARFYENATGRPLPISHISSANLEDATNVPLSLLTTVNAYPWNDRLNEVGVWNSAANTPYNEWIGFTACIQIAEEKTYYIGIAGDNYVRFSLNGDIVFESSNGSVDAFRNWFMIPITLPAGTHNIVLEGLNLGSIAAFGAEIYDADQATLAAMTTVEEIDAVTVFSTQDKIGQTFDTGEQSGCQCPDGYALSNCDGQLTCVRIETADFEPCPCYLATNCDDPSDQILITLEEGDEPLDPTLTYVFEFDPDKCWTIEESTACQGDPIFVNTGTIDAAGTVGPEDAADFLWNVIGEPPGGTPPASPYPASVSDQSWFAGYGSLPGAAWITQTPTPHAQTTGETIYEATFNIPVGFVPTLEINLLTDNTGQVYLNGNLIADTTAAPSPWVTPLNVIETTLAYFNVGGSNTLEVRVQNVGQGSNGFNMTAELRSSEPLGQVVTIVDTFVDCQDCNGTCYQLTNCETQETIIVENDLTQYVGKIIEVFVSQDVTLCLLVEEIPCQGATIVALPGTIVDCHDTCEDCLPEPEPEPEPLVIRDRTVRPGWNTKGCPPEYVEKVSCRFAEAMYQKVASIRYGIEFCCNDDADKWMIKKELLNLKGLLDPEACLTETAQCCPPCNLTAEIVRFCDPPTYLIGRIVIT